MRNEEAFTKGSYTLSLEGPSENFVCSLEHVAEQFQNNLQREVRIAPKSQLGELPTIELRLEPNETTEIEVLCDLKLPRKILTASTFCWGVENALDVGIGLKTDGNAIFRTFRSNRHYDRHEVTLPLSAAASEASLKLKIKNTVDKSVLALVAFPCVEAFPKASSPILPGSKRAPSLLNLKDPRMVFSDQDKGTIFLIFRPKLDFFHWRGIESGILFGAHSEINNHQLNVFIAGDGGYLVLETFDGKHRKQITTKERPVTSEVCAITLTWDVGRLEFYINGNSVGVLQGVGLNVTSFNHVRIGNHPLSESFAANINCYNFAAYPDRFPEWKIKAALFEFAPEHFALYQSVMDGLIEVSESRWPSTVVEKLFKVANSWQQNPPVWASGSGIDEGVFRDDLSRILTMDFPTANESQCADGRTDLLIELAERRKVRIEFKVWGRHDYKEVPKKPLKYMTDSEEIGIVVMLNTNKVNVDRKYVFNVLTKSPGCIWHVENPFVNDLGMFHFISEHVVDGKRFSFLHVVFNTQKPLNRDSTLRL